MDHRVIDTNALIALNTKAIENDLNRAISPEWLNSDVDPEGMHVISRFMVHEHRAGVATRPHYRCQVLVKTNNKVEPEMLWIDVYPEDYERLPKPMSYAV